jgi:hypothetical protein
MPKQEKNKKFIFCQFSEFPTQIFSKVRSFIDIIDYVLSPAKGYYCRKLGEQVSLMHTNMTRLFTPFSPKITFIVSRSGSTIL